MVTNLNSNKDRKHIIKQIKKCIVLNLEDRIYGMMKDIKKMSILSKRDALFLINFMKKKNIYSTNLLSYIYIKSHHINSPSIPDLDNETLMKAVSLNQIELVRFLLSDKIRQLYPKIDPHTNHDFAIKHSSERGLIEIVKLLIESFNENIDISISLNTAIRFASKNGHLEVVKYLLSKEIVERFPNTLIDPSTYDNYAINKAGGNNYIEVVKFLLSDEIRERFSGINPSTGDCNVLLSMCFFGQLNMVKFLLSDEMTNIYPLINPCVGGNESPISYACRREQIEVLEYLFSEEILDKYPSIDSNLVNSLLGSISILSSYTVMKFLLSDYIMREKRFHEVDPSINENRAIEFAVGHCGVGMVKLLLRDHRVIERGLNKSISLINSVTKPKNREFMINLLTDAMNKN